MSTSANGESRRSRKALEAWRTQSVVTCEHRYPGKEIKSKDPTGPPLDYMVSHNIFKVKQASGYNLYHFYQVGSLGIPPPFPLPHGPATCEKLLDFLHKARAEGRSNLIVMHTSNSVTAVSFAVQSAQQNQPPSSPA